MYEEQTDTFVQELWRLLPFLEKLNQFLLNSLCPTHSRDRNTYVQTHAVLSRSDLLILCFSLCRGLIVPMGQHPELHFDDFLRAATIRYEMLKVCS